MVQSEQWDYETLVRILRDELPLTMTLGLLTILVERMVEGSVFAARVDGVVAAVRTIAAEAAGGNDE